MNAAFAISMIWALAVIVICLFWIPDLIEKRQIKRQDAIRRARLLRQIDHPVTWEREQ